MSELWIFVDTPVMDIRLLSGRRKASNFYFLLGFSRFKIFSLQFSEFGTKRQYNPFLFMYFFDFRHEESNWSVALMNTVHMTLY